MTRLTVAIQDMEVMLVLLTYVVNSSWYLVGAMYKCNCIITCYTTISYVCAHSIIVIHCL